MAKTKHKTVSLSMFREDPKNVSEATVPEIPFSAIDEYGAGMYQGKKITRAERHDGAQGSELNRRIPPESGHPTVG